MENGSVLARFPTIHELKIDLSGAVAFSHDGSLLAVAWGGDSVALWNVGTRHSAGMLRTNGGISGQCVAFSPDDQMCVAGGNDGTIKRWDVKTGQELDPLSCHGGQVTSVAFSTNGRILASAAEDNKIKIWDVRAGDERLSLNGHSNVLGTNVAFSREDDLLISVSHTAHESIKVFRAATQRDVTGAGEMYEP
jgi:WD40 repeat protein